MKKNIILLLLFFSMTSYSQKGNLAKNIFILRFLEENILITKNITTGKQIFNSDVIEINLDSINSYGSNIVFYKFTLGKNTIKLSDDKIDMALHMTSCGEYIMGYNLENNNSYRIKGFNGNDFYHLIKDINQSTYKPKNLKKILIELNELSTGADFQCIYKSLQKLDFNSFCLKACIEGKELH